MIRHQTETGNRETLGKTVASQEPQVFTAVVIAEKYILAVVATLRDVVGVTGQGDAKAAGHAP